MLNIGTQTTSLVNHLHSRAVIGEPAPKVGMGCTILGWSDRNPGTIQSVTELTSKVYLYEIEVTSDDSQVVSGSEHDGSATYKFTPCPAGYRSLYRKNKKTGFWEATHRNEAGRLVKTKSGQGIRIGERDKYRDPSF